MPIYEDELLLCLSSLNIFSGSLSISIGLFRKQQTYYKCCDITHLQIIFDFFDFSVQIKSVHLGHSNIKEYTDQLGNLIEHPLDHRKGVILYRDLVLASADVPLRIQELEVEKQQTTQGGERVSYF